MIKKLEQDSRFDPGVALLKLHEFKKVIIWMCCGVIIGSIPIAFDLLAFNIGWSEQLLGYEMLWLAFFGGFTGARLGLLSPERRQYVFRGSRHGAIMGLALGAILFLLSLLIEGGPYWLAAPFMTFAGFCGGGTLCIFAREPRS